MSNKSELISTMLAQLSAPLSEEEKNALTQILMELKESGSSQTFSDLWEEDYEEIPINIDKFIEDDNYLGKSLNNGRSIYPYWRNFLREVFPDNNGSTNKYHEIIITGAIGLGKTFIAVICMCYVLYKVLCLKDPQRYFRLVPGSEIVFAFFNITLDLAKGVAFQSFNELLLSSPWFMAHGTKIGTKHIEYVPDKGIKFLAGSKPSHALGNNVLCLSQHTKVRTSKGFKYIKDLVAGDVIYSYNLDTNSVEPYELNNDSVQITGLVDELVQVELEDGSSILCTPDHKFLTNSHKWVSAQDLLESDELLDITI